MEITERKSGRKFSPSVGRIHWGAYANYAVRLDFRGTTRFYSFIAKEYIIISLIFALLLCQHGPCGTTLLKAGYHKSRTLHKFVTWECIFISLISSLLLYQHETACNNTANFSNIHLAGKPEAKRVQCQGLNSIPGRALCDGLHPLILNMRRLSLN